MRQCPSAAELLGDRYIQESVTLYKQRDVEVVAA